MRKEKMKIFKRNLLEFLLELYDAHTSSGYEPSKKKQDAIEEMRTALYRPKRFRCHFKSRGLCVFSLSPYHMKKCVGINNCIEAISKKKEEQSIIFE